MTLLKTISFVTIFCSLMISCKTRVSPVATEKSVVNDKLALTIKVTGTTAEFVVCPQPIKADKSNCANPFSFKQQSVKFKLPNPEAGSNCMTVSQQIGNECEIASGTARSMSAVGERLRQTCGVDDKQPVFSLTGTLPMSASLLCGCIGVLSGDMNLVATSLGAFMIQSSCFLTASRVRKESGADKLSQDFRYLAANIEKVDGDNPHEINMKIKDAVTLIAAANNWTVVESVFR